MPYRTDVFLKGSVYHIYRGCNRTKIFLEEENYIFLLRKIKEYIIKFDISVIAYCLMPNHYHLILRQNSVQPLNTCVQHIFNSYTKAINRRYNRDGTLFEGRFKAKEIYDDKTILEVCRYVHRNPLDDGLVNNLEDWGYSNYHEWIGIRNGKLWDHNFVLKHFPKPSDYKRYVLDYYSFKQIVKDLKKLGLI